MSMNAPSGFTRSRRARGAAPAWAPPSNGAYRPGATALAPSPTVPAAPKAPRPRSSGPANKGLLAAEGIVAVGLVAGIVVLGLGFSHARSTESAAKHTLAAATASTQAAQASAQHAAASVAADRQIGAVLAVAAKTVGTFEDSLADDYAINGQSDATALVQKQIDGYTAQLSSLNGLALPTNLEPQLAAIKGALAKLATASKSVLATINSNANSIAPSVPADMTQAMQSIEEAQGALEGALGKN